MATKKTLEQIAADIEDIANTSDVHLRAEKIKKFGVKNYFEQFANMLGTPQQMVSPLESEWKCIKRDIKDTYGYIWSVSYTVDGLGVVQMANITPVNLQVKPTSDSDIILGKKKDDVKEMVVTSSKDLQNTSFTIQST